MNQRRCSNLQLTPLVLLYRPEAYSSAISYLLDEHDKDKYRERKTADCTLHNKLPFRDANLPIPTHDFPRCIIERLREISFSCKSIGSRIGLNHRATHRQLEIDPKTILKVGHIDLPTREKLS